MNKTLKYILIELLSSFVLLLILAIPILLISLIPLSIGYVIAADVLYFIIFLLFIKNKISELGIFKNNSQLYLEMGFKEKTVINSVPLIGFALLFIWSASAKNIFVVVLSFILFVYCFIRFIRYRR